MERPDVVIIGAGPAGSTAAYRLARAGVNVMVLERDAVAGARAACGGGLAFALKQRLQLPDRIIAEAISNAELLIGRRTLAISSQQPMFISVHRREFDAFLAQRAEESGADIRYGCRVTAVEPRTRSLRWERRSGAADKLPSAGLIIYADGCPTMAYPAHGIGHSPADPAFLALAWEFPRPPDTGDAFQFFLDPEELPLGYFWLFPKGDVVNVGVGGPERVMRGQLTRLLSRFVRDRLGITAAPLLSRGGWIPDRGCASRLSGDGAVVVGDAAGLVNPLTGGGLIYAITSGELAACACLNVLGSDGTGWPALGCYDTMLRRTLMYPWLRLMAMAQRWSVRQIEQQRPSTVPALLNAYFKFFRTVQPLIAKLT